MRTASTALKTFLASNSTFYMAELYTLLLSRDVGFDPDRGMNTDAGTGFTKCTWTAYDQDLTVGGIPFSHFGPIISRGGTRQASGIEVTTMELTLQAGDWVLPNGQKLPYAAALGAFDGATVKVERLIMPTPGDVSLGAINWFEGRVAEVAPSSYGVKLTLKSGLEKLNRPFPRRLFQPNCPHALYGPACGVAKTVGVRAFNRTTTAGSTTTVINYGTADAADVFKLGTITFTSGALAGMTRTVITNGGGVITVGVPFPSAPAVGDTFQATHGCDKTTGSGGCAKFANLNNFGGYPYVPKPESIR